MLFTESIFFKHRLSWHAPKLLEKPKCGSQKEIMEKKKLGHAHNIFGVGGCVRVPGWDYVKLTSNSSRWNQPAQPRKKDD
jgi:hypothetical protein